MAADDVGIGTSQSQGIDSVGLQTGYQILVDQSAIDHRHHLQHLLIGDAAAIDHVGLDIQALGYLRGLAATAMYQHLATLDGRKVL